MDKSLSQTTKHPANENLQIYSQSTAKQFKSSTGNNHEQNPKNHTSFTKKSEESLARFNSIDNISKKFTTIAKINSIGDINTSDSKSFTMQSPSSHQTLLAKPALKDHTKASFAKQLSSSIHSIDHSLKNSDLKTPLNRSEHFLNARPESSSLHRPKNEHQTSILNMLVPASTFNGASNDTLQKLRSKLLMKKDQNNNNYM
jgi:hypothetical protein